MVIIRLEAFERLGDRDQASSHRIGVGACVVRQSHELSPLILIAGQLVAVGVCRSARGCRGCSRPCRLSSPAVAAWASSSSPASADAGCHGSAWRSPVRDSPVSERPDEFLPIVRPSGERFSHRAVASKGCDRCSTMAEAISIAAGGSMEADSKHRKKAAGRSSVTRVMPRRVPLLGPEARE